MNREVSIPRRMQMVQEAVWSQNVSMRFACWLFVVSKSRCRYQPQLNEINEVIANWQLHITDKLRNQGFCLCFFGTCAMSKASGSIIKGCTGTIVNVAKYAHQAQKRLRKFTMAENRS